MASVAFPNWSTLPSVIILTVRKSSGCHLCLRPVLYSIPTGVGGLASFRRALEGASNVGVFQGIPLVSHTTSRRHSCCTTAVQPGHTISAPQRKLMCVCTCSFFYNRTEGRGARSETRFVSIHFRILFFLLILFC